MFCTNCGNEVTEQAAACPKCGFNPRRERKFCFNCGTSIDTRQIMCVKCGVSLKGAALNALASMVGSQTKSVASFMGRHKSAFGKLAGAFVEKTAEVLAETSRTAPKKAVTARNADLDVELGEIEIDGLEDEVESGPVAEEAATAEYADLEEAEESDEEEEEDDEDDD